jgi:plastocyanin
LAIMKGDSTVKDAEICAAMDLYKEDLIVDPATSGIANVFVYMPKKPANVEFDEPETKKIIFDQKNCRFVPHAMIVRTGQTVEVISSDGCAHNFHTFPIRNDPMNVLMAPNTPEGKGVEVKYEGPEILPMKVGCDIHPWMQAWWHVVDHPFAAVTNEKGEFTIEGLPDGDYDFRLWHERSGYLERKLTITVKGDVTEVKPLEYELSRFDD